MGLPVAPTTGHAFASLRARLQALLPAAPQARGGGLAAYRSPFPRRLRLARAALVALSLVWLAAGSYALFATGSITRIIGHDTAPSVAAAERIRAGVADANADFSLAVLAGEGADSAFMADMRRQLRGVRAALVAAAGNVTYGAEETGPIGTVLQGLGEYEQLVGRAGASQGAARDELAFAADDALHWTVLPAAAILERVNADHLEAAYSAYGDRWLLPWLIVAAVALLALLAAVQLDMARTARRIVNPLVALATVAVAVASVSAALALGAVQEDLRVAKRDAFDSVYALSTTGALAADADAAQSYLLLASGDPARKARYAAGFAALAHRLLGVSVHEALSALRGGVRPAGDGGYIGDELANITFQGEREAAIDLVSSWRGVLESDEALNGPDTAERRAAAIASKTTDLDGGARRAFAGFDAALGEVLAINQDAFAAAIGRAEDATGPIWVAVILGFAVALASAWFGIRQRLDEYRF